MWEKNEMSQPGLRERYRAWKAGLNPRERLRWRIIRIAAAIVAGLILLWTVYSLVVRRPEIPSVQSGADVSNGEERVDVGTRRSGVYTFLVVGKDTGGGGNTDTMILATYDTKRKTVDAMSLPRDTMTNVSWSNKKLNTIYNHYKGKDKTTQVEKGMAALKTHVDKLTGILPDYYVMVEWEAVGQLVDAIGGVIFDVPYDMHYDDPAQDLYIHQEKGERRLSGEDAMQVIRWRKNNGKYGNLQIGDSGRMKIQQDFLTAVARECLQVKHLLNASEFARIFTEHVNTDLTVGNLAWLARQAIGMSVEENIRFHTMPFTNYTRGTAYVLPVVDELLALLNDGLNPYKQDITAEDLEVLQLKSNGSMYLTSGTLEDSSLAKPRKPKEPAKPAPQPEQPTVAEEPGVVTTPEQSGQEPVQPPEEAPAQPEQPPVELTPENTDVPVQTEPKPTQPEAEQEPVNVLPADPVPVPVE